MNNQRINGSLQRLRRYIPGSISMLLVMVCTFLFLALKVLDLLHIVSWQRALSVLGLSYVGVVRLLWLFQFFTAPLLHANIWHLVFNMLLLWMLGPDVERALGRPRYVFFSLLCAGCSMVGFLLCNLGTRSIGLGYSGVIFGILVAQAMFYPNRRIFIFFFFPLKMKHAVLLFSAVELYFVVSQDGSGIAHSAHLFGAVSALLYLKGMRWWSARKRAIPIHYHCAQCGTELRFGHGPLCARCVVQKFIICIVNYFVERYKKSWLFRRIRGYRVLCPRASCGYWERVVSVKSDDGPYVCSRCQQLLPRTNKQTPMPQVLAVIGAERCGKTSLLVRSLDALCKEADSYGFPLDGQEEQWRALRQILELGKALPRTQATPGVAWCFERLKDGVQQRLHVCDMSGQEFGSPNRLARYHIFQNLNGFVLVVDPFGLPSLQRRYGAIVRNMRPPVEPAKQAFGEEHLAAVLQTLETFRCRPRGGRWDLSVAVVVTKLDVMGLIRNFGDEENATEASVDGACKRQLKEWGFESMMRALDLHFRRVGYFASYPRGNGAFSPGNPLIWLLTGEG